MYYCVFLLLIFTPGYANESILSPYPLQSILDNTAAYCERLKTAAFHYSCTEKIVEIIEKYIKGKDIKPDLIRFLTRYKETPSHGKFDNFNTRSERNEFISQYQAIQKDNKRLSIFFQFLTIEIAYLIRSTRCRSIPWSITS